METVKVTGGILFSPLGFSPFAQVRGGCLPKLYETFEKSFVNYLLSLKSVDTILVIQKFGDDPVATLDDIARELGISKSTVSKALNGAKDVSKAMRQTVLEKAVELGYSRAVRGNALPKIAVFITNMDYARPEDFGYELVVGFRKAAEPAGFQVDIVPLGQQMQLQISYDAYMIRENYCGSLFLGLSLLDPWIKDFETSKIPAVLYDNHIGSNPRVTHVGVNNTEGMELAVKYLKDLGHRRIGYLSSALQAYVYQQRYYAFFQAMKANGLHMEERLAGNAYFVNECLSQHLPRILDAGCTAIVCSHDILAHSVMVHCGELGYRVPEDISILGFDDIPLCKYTNPALSTIRQNRTNIGKSAFFALLNQINDVHVSSLLLHPELVPRDSCASIAAE